MSATVPRRTIRRAHMTGPARAARGFTLLEILIATSLLALALGLAYASIRVAIGSSRSGEALIERTDEVRVTQSFLRRQLSHAMPLMFEQLEDTGEQKVFEADAEFVRFVAPMPGHLARGGPHVQWLSLVPDGTGVRIEFDHAQLNGYDPDEPKDADARPPVVLMEGMADARFQFRDIDPETGELGDWMDEWEDPMRMPVAVRLAVSYRDGDQRMWPDFEVPLRLSQTVGLGGRLGTVRRPPRRTFPEGRN